MNWTTIIAAGLGEIFATTQRFRVAYCIYYKHKFGWCMSMCAFLLVWHSLLRCRFRGTSKYFSTLGKNGPFLAVSYPRLLFAPISIESRWHSPASNNSPRKCGSSVRHHYIRSTLPHTRYTSVRDEKVIRSILLRRIDLTNLAANVGPTRWLDNWSYMQFIAPSQQGKTWHSVIQFLFSRCLSVCAVCTVLLVRSTLFSRAFHFRLMMNDSQFRLANGTYYLYVAQKHRLTLLVTRHF